MLLVTGATGHVGRFLVDELNQRGAKFRALVRSPRDDLPAEQLIGDLDGPLDLRGVDTVFLLVPGTGLEHTGNVVSAARTAGVRRIVYLSTRPTSRPPRRSYSPRTATRTSSTH
ncbi:SDR family oxidoreductase [Kribbella solani]|uniref:SDR family oxidoreductase n=1 Tax=Kribbella solani TaxID=236067 RepID=UPI0029A00898|nr:NmrA family NAD(P)-binding protein [Kribbella solani]MDX2969815.1 NmrA family NAD(P)-binding protein [Kribbella solani]